MSRMLRVAVLGLGALVLGLWLAACQGAGAQGPACAAPEPICAARAADLAAIRGFGAGNSP